MIPVREFILSLGSPAAISWTGFVVLALALIGEAGIFLVPEKLDRIHKTMGFWLAILAAAGYAIERIGDDAIIDGARHELAQIEAARIVTPSQQQIVVQLLADAAKGPVSIAYPMTDSTDARAFAETIKETLKKAGYTLIDAPQGYAGMLSFSEPGAFLLVHNLTEPSPIAAAHTKSVCQNRHIPCGRYQTGHPGGYSSARREFPSVLTDTSASTIGGRPN